MISLKDLLKTPRFSDLQLLTKNETLTGEVISSVEITETPDVFKFIPQNVFILSTAMVFQDNQQELIPFIDSLISAKAIGLAIKVDRFLNKIDEEVIAYANKVNFPLLAVPNHYPLGSLLHRIMNLVLETEREEIDFALDVQKRFSDLLVNGASNNILVDEFSRMIKSPIILLNPFGEMTSFSKHFRKNLEKAEFYIQEISKKRLAKNRTIESFIIEGLNGDSTHISLIKINAYTYFPHFLMIINPEKVPYPTSVFAFEQAALIFQFNLYKNQKVDESIYANEAHFFNDMINNQTRRTFTEANWLSISRNYGYISSDYYQVINVNSEDIISEEHHTPSLKSKEKLLLSFRWLRSHIDDYFDDALVIWQAENNEIILLLQEKPDDLSFKLITISNKIHSQFGSVLLFDVGYPIEDWNQFEQSYTQAKFTYNERQKNGINDTVLYYKDNGFEQLFNHLDQNEIIYFCKEVLKDLAYPADSSKADLRKTLDSYLKNQGEITQTSNELFIHRNTVNYRINRCEEILGVKVNSPEASLNIRLALELSKQE